MTTRQDTCALSALLAALRARSAGAIEAATRGFLALAWDPSPTIRGRARRELALIGVVVRDEPVPRLNADGDAMNDLTAGEVG